MLVAYMWGQASALVQAGTSTIPEAVDFVDSVCDPLPEPINEARNRALHEAYKELLRQQMSKPHVQNADLARLVDKLYRGDATVGSGSTADAIRHELATGKPVKGVWHSEKGEGFIRALEKWLRKNPTASPSDRAAAQNIILDLKNALGK